MYPKDLKYIKEHMWIKIIGNKAVIGITAYAQESLGELTFVDLPQVGDHFAAGEVICIVESAKSVSEVYTPLTGKISAINDEIIDLPTLVNGDPYGKGWMVKIEFEDNNFVGLISADEYEEYLKEL